MNELNIDKTNWKKYRFDEIVQNISERVEPSQTDLDLYVGLEHIDPDTFHLGRHGHPSDVEGTKLRFYKGDIIFGRRCAYQRKTALATTDGICSSIEFIKELCQIARETLQAEKQVAEIEVRKTGKEALTELFMELRTEDTPAVVGRIVSDIDSIVKVVRFPGWQTSNAGEREVQRALRKTLLKYKLHKEEALYQKAYMYIKEYY